MLSADEEPSATPLVGGIIFLSLTIQIAVQCPRAEMDALLQDLRDDAPRRGSGGDRRRDRIDYRVWRRTQRFRSRLRRPRLRSAGAGLDDDRGGVPQLRGGSAAGWAN